MEDSLLVSRALALATRAHEGQEYRPGVPYMAHVCEVWVRCLRAGLYAPAIQCTALLHDTVEDTYVKLGGIEHAFGWEIRRAVDAITKRKGELYQEALERVKANEIARKVKIHDMSANLSNTALIVGDDARRDRLREKYTQGLKFLSS